MNRKSIGRLLRRLLLATIAFLALFLFIILPIGGSYLITNSRFRFPERGPQRPEDVGLSVSPVEFSSDDGIPLKGWWNPGDSSKPVIIFCHGLNRSRLELLKRAGESSRRGYGVLLFDLRNHGESGRGYTTLGIEESRDACAAGEVVAEKAPTRAQFLWGVSMGASTAILAAKRCGGFSAIVADSSFVSFRETISHHFTLYFRLPSFPIANMITFITGLRMRIDPNQGDVEAAVKEIGIPILFIAGGADRRMPPELAQRMFEAASNPDKDLLVVPNAAHGQAFATDPITYLNSVYRFLEHVGYNPTLSRRPGG